MHSILAPSNAGVWVNCPGSIQITPHGLMQDPDTGLEGEASHTVAARRLAHPTKKQIMLGARFNHDGVVITSEMAECAEVYVQDVLAIGLGKPENSGIEQRVAALRIHKEVFGTVDTWVYHPHTRTLYIWDYKYGWGLVEAFENQQLICYAIGLIDKVSKAHGISDEYIKVNMRVVQPRPYHAEGPVREWAVKAVDLRGYANHLSMAAEAALRPDPDITTGEHCRYCLGRVVCPAARGAALHAVDVTEKAAVLDLPVEAVSEEYAVLLRAAKAIEYRVTGLAAQLTAQIKGGEVVPGWCLEPGRGKREWNKPPEEIIALGDAFGLDFKKPLSVITPAQAEKLKGMDKAMVAGFTSTEAGALKLTPFEKTAVSRAFKPQTKE